MDISSPSSDETVRTAKTLANDGRPLEAYNFLMRALEDGAPSRKNAPQQYAEYLRARSWPLRYQAALSLARIGAREEAGRLISLMGLDQPEDGLTPAQEDDRLCLPARLLKDLALELPEDERAPVFAAAADVYEVAWARVTDVTARNTFPGINAATLRVLSGEQARGMEIATAVLSVLERTSAGEDPWHAAAVAEARLILGDHAGAVAAVATAAVSDKLGLLDKGQTIRQMRLLGRAVGFEGDPAGMLAPGPVIFYSGHMIAPSGSTGRIRTDAEGELSRRIRAALDSITPSAAVGSLACGSDILFAEALLDRGAQLHVVLPFAVRDFVSLSVDNGGPNWKARFQACYDRASSVRYVTTEGYLGSNILFGQCARLGVGQTILMAQQIGARCGALVVWDGEVTGGNAGTSHDLEVMRAAEINPEIIDCSDLSNRPLSLPSSSVMPNVQKASEPQTLKREQTVMLFGDLAGFSCVSDEAMPTFIQEVMGRIGAAMRSRDRSRAFENTWGDGLFAVFDDPAGALEEAMAIQNALKGLNYGALGLPSEMGLRLACHMGVVWRARDPVTGKANYYGEAVARTARMEPVTPPDSIYVSEAFAAELALDAASPFTAEYVGEVPTAKDYGTMHLYRLRRRHPHPHPQHGSALS